jgi:ABC-type glycerol-3-phosphate transport system permease component
MIDGNSTRRFPAVPLSCLQSSSWSNSLHILWQYSPARAVRRQPSRLHPLRRLHGVLIRNDLSFPTPPTLANYTGLADAGFGRGYVATALMTAVILLGYITFSVLVAYAFARLHFPGRLPVP